MSEDKLDIIDEELEDLVRQMKKAHKELIMFVRESNKKIALKMKSIEKRVQKLEENRNHV